MKVERLGNKRSAFRIFEILAHAAAAVAAVVSTVSP